MNSLEKRKKNFFSSALKIISYIFSITWGAQGQMTQIKILVNSLPRELAEFSFFLIIGFTAGSIGLIWEMKKL